MSRQAEEVLEFDRLLELLRLRTTCAPGRRFVEGLRTDMPAPERERSFALIREAREWLRSGAELGFGALEDPEGWLARLPVPALVLEPTDFLNACSLLDTSDALRLQLGQERAEYPLLGARVAELADFQQLRVTLRRSILPNGEVSDEASRALARIRANIVRTRDSLQKALQQILRSRQAAASESYVTLRNDRYVIPVRSEHRRNVPGVLHGASSTGQTVFVEPFETVESNNQLVQLAEEESAEVFRILTELTDRLRSLLPALEAATETIAEFDSIFARARFARDFDACIPEFSLAELRLESARHPVLEDKLKKEQRTIVPTSLTLAGEERVLVISGPNTGGKTVVLKTTGLAALAARAAIPVAAQRAVLPEFERVLVDIGDEQSIAADLSTFSSHMLNLKQMLARATPDCLVLADEMGTGTAPEEGAALAVALLDAFRKKGSFVLATTHHDRLKTYASTTPGVVNAAVEFDDLQLRPTFRLRVGVPGGSSGILIAGRLGLEPALLEQARSLLSPESLEAAQLIAYLHRSRDELGRLREQLNEEHRALERERTQLRTEWVERQKRRIAQLEQDFLGLQKSFEERLARAVEAVAERELRTELEKRAHRKLQQVRAEAREEWNQNVVRTLSESQSDLDVRSGAPEKVAVDQLPVGARIYVRGFPKPVILRRLEEASAEIEAGPLRMKVAVEDITGIADPTAPPPAGRPAAGQGITVTSQPSEPGSGEEINVIGLTVEQASEKVDKFLDEAALAHRQRVRIIHGHGTGALRRGLAEFLKTHPLVEHLEFADEEHGGKAITLVALRA